MTLWVILTLMACAASLWVAIPQVRRYDDRRVRANAAPLAIYEEQLREIDRDTNAGTLEPSAAAAARLEVQRRMIAAARATMPERPLSPAWRGLALLSTTGFVAIASVMLYAKLGNPALQPMQGAAVASTPDAGVPRAGQVDDLLAKLETRLAANPSDAEGWRMLGWSYFNMQRYVQSAEAYQNALAADPRNADYRASYGEALVQANQGIVSADAAAAFAQALQDDAKNPRARFYEALRLEQSGDKPGSYDAWMALAKDAPADAGWLPEVQTHIANLGSELGKGVTAFTKPAAEAQVSPAPVISQDDVAAAQAMPAEAQQEMIRNMVDGLAAKLEANPRDADGWIKLMRSRMVLQDSENASRAFSKALSVFSDDAVVQAKLKAAAAEFGVTEN